MSHWEAVFNIQFQAGRDPVSGGVSLFSIIGN